jgi:hypothetical protein
MATYDEAIQKILMQGELAMQDFRKENQEIDKSFRDGAMTKHVEELLNENNSTLDEETRRYLSRRAGSKYRPDQSGGSPGPETGEEETGQGVRGEGGADG